MLCLMDPMEEYEEESHSLARDFLILALEHENQKEEPDYSNILYLIKREMDLLATNSEELLYYANHFNPGESEIESIYVEKSLEYGVFPEVLGYISQENVGKCIMEYLELDKYLGLIQARLRMFR